MASLVRFSVSSSSTELTVIRMENFDLDQRELALARFEELNPFGRLGPRRDHGVDGRASAEVAADMPVYGPQELKEELDALRVRCGSTCSKLGCLYTQ